MLTPVSGSLVELAKALSKAQSEMPTISLDKKVSFQGVFFEYASLSNIIFNTKPVLARHGLTVLQFPSTQDRKVTVETMLLHDSGEYVLSTLSSVLPPPKVDKQTGLPKADDPKEMSSLISYNRRYAYASILGIALDGDYDAELLMPKYDESSANKAWLARTLEPMGVTDKEVLRKISAEMLRGNFEMTEESIMRCLETVRK
ncbi:MAG TPA: ERF family protein [Oligoflexus sp.]|uniref:ERF family protein n=1 Tax=Oligoflexus sp. TaxID=1971216 RepID=UPI002D241133|nr:ERF family protein [Oligoflexus sp.]HYX39950.1 ERF family protein [Oligoflexus sp.]